jgi:hypothetical protein
MKGCWSHVRSSVSQFVMTFARAKAGAPLPSRLLHRPRKITTILNVRIELLALTSGIDFLRTTSHCYAILVRWCTDRLAALLEDIGLGFGHLDTALHKDIETSQHLYSVWTIRRILIKHCAPDRSRLPPRYHTKASISVPFRGSQFWARI